MRSRGASQVLWLILMLFVLGITYVTCVYFYSEILSTLIDQLGYSPPANFDYLDQFIYGFIWVFLISTIIVFIIESYRKSRVEGI